MTIKKFEKLLIVEDGIHDSKFCVDFPEGQKWIGVFTGYGSLDDAFNFIKEMLSKGCHSIYLSLDMKPNENIGMDYIAIYYFDQRRQWNCYLIPYKNDELLPAIKESETIDYLLSKINQALPLNN